MQVRACTIRLLDSTGRNLEPVAVYGLSETYLKKGPMDALTNLLAREVLSGKIVIVPDALESPLLQYPEEARQEGIRSMISAPLTGKDGAFGIIRAYAIEINRFTQEDKNFFEAIAAQGSIAIENALSYKAIEELDQTKSQFIRTITHELRSPVAVTQSLLRTLVSGFAGQVTDQQMDILNRAVRRVEFLQKLIDDLLDLATGKANVQALKQREPVGLKSTLQKVVERFTVSAHEKNIRLEQIYPDSPDEFIVMASPDGIDRIFNNLIANAIKYTLPDGEVSTKIELMDSEVVITISDTGIGIPQESMPHLFEEFYRAPNAKEMEREGTGLGLTIVKDLVTRYSGRIAVQSEENRGTKFIVSFVLYKGTREVSK
jgi:signal transduction histidine kinase